MTVEEFYHQERNEKPKIKSCFADEVGITYSSGELEGIDIHTPAEMKSFAEAYHQAKLKLMGKDKASVCGGGEEKVK